MAERRMFAKTIIDSDAFLDMPLTAQALYFHLSMRADDEGFINNPKKIQRVIGASEDDLKLLIDKKFIISFESGIVVIKHWKIHNYIRADRITETKYTEEKELLETKENGSYTINSEAKEIDKLDARDKRKIAYKESTLPYSFSYKMKRAFEGRLCPVCGIKMTSAYKSALPTVQHNIPISKGGAHEIENISIICEACNTSIKDNETGSLNNEEVIEIWDKIMYAEDNKISWFNDPKILENIEVSQMTVKCQSNDGQVSDICQSNVSIGKDRIGKDRLDKVSIGESTADEPPRAPDKPKKHKYGIFNHVLLTDDEMSKLVSEYGLAETNEAIKYLDEYVEMKGTKYKSHYLALRKWVFDAVKEKKRTVKPNSFNDIASLQRSSGGFDEIVEAIEGG